MNIPNILLALILTTIISNGEPTPTPAKGISYDQLQQSIRQGRGKDAITKPKSILDFAISSSQDKAKEVIPNLYIKFGTRKLGDRGYVAKVNSRKTPSSQRGEKETIAKAKSVLDVEESSSQDIANEAIPKLHTKFGTRKLGDGGYVAKVNSRKTPSSQYEEKETIAKAKSVLDVEESSSQDIANEAIPKLYTKFGTRKLGDGGIKTFAKQDTNYGTRRLGDGRYKAGKVNSPADWGSLGYLFGWVGAV